MLNMLSLNYDTFLNSDAGVKSVTRETVKEAAHSSTLAGVISDDMKMYAVDIVFRKKPVEDLKIFAVDLKAPKV